MAAEDYIPDYDPDDEDQLPPQCNRCGAEDLEWVHTGKGWRLADDKGLHYCKSAPDDFDDLTE